MESLRILVLEGWKVGGFGRAAGVGGLGGFGGPEGWMRFSILSLVLGVAFLASFGKSAGGRAVEGQQNNCNLFEDFDACFWASDGPCLELQRMLRDFPSTCVAA